EPIDDYATHTEPIIDLYCPSTGTSRRINQNSEAASEARTKSIEASQLRQAIMLNPSQTVREYLICQKTQKSKKAQPYECLTCGVKFDLKAELRLHFFNNQGHTDQEQVSVVCNFRRFSEE
ncbi:hypothetical protein PMAYCL1PPCAC_20052, partial [Pristionchus mayeri]